MRRIQKKDIWLFMAQVLLLSLIVLSPGLVSFITSRDSKQVFDALSISFYFLVSVFSMALVPPALLAIWSCQRAVGGCPQLADSVL